LPGGTNGEFVSNTSKCWVVAFQGAVVAWWAGVARHTVAAGSMSRLKTMVARRLGGPSDSNWSLATKNIPLMVGLAL
jgi:hypothetical protein